MTQTQTTWKLCIDRGPNWLMVKATQGADDDPAATSLVEMLWALMQRNLTYRMVLELDDRDDVDSSLIEELISLDRRARVCDGFLRVCGLTKPTRERLHRSSPSGHFDWLPYFEDRRDAVFGFHRPRQPR